MRLYIRGRTRSRKPTARCERDRQTVSDLPRKTLRLSDLSTRGETAFELTPTPEERAAVAEALGIRGLRKLRFSGVLAPQGRSDWRLEADLGATVVQDCVVTLEPVATRIDEEVARLYLADWREPEGEEVEMPEDDSVEPLPASLDLVQVMLEALALALPPYPRADGVEPVEMSVTEPGKQPMTDDEARPFAGLKALRDRMEGE